MVGVVSPSGVCRGMNVPADDVVPTISSRCLRAPVQIAEMWAATVAWTTSEAAACEERHLRAGGRRRRRRTDAVVTTFGIYTRNQPSLSALWSRRGVRFTKMDIFLYIHPGVVKTFLLDPRKYHVRMIG